MTRSCSSSTTTTLLVACRSIPAYSTLLVSSSRAVNWGLVGSRFPYSTARPRSLLDDYQVIAHHVAVSINVILDAEQVKIVKPHRVERIIPDRFEAGFWFRKGSAAGQHDAGRRGAAEHVE